MPVVLNKYKMTPEQTGVSIMRGTPYGNRYILDVDGDRDEVCDFYEIWINFEEQSPLRQQMKRQLKGKNLICVCKQPHKFVRCHGDTILKIANEE